MGTRPTSDLGSDALWPPLVADTWPWRFGVALHSLSRSDLSKEATGFVVASAASRSRAWSRRSRAMAVAAGRREVGSQLERMGTGSVTTRAALDGVDCPRGSASSSGKSANVGGVARRRERHGAAFSGCRPCDTLITSPAAGNYLTPLTAQGPAGLDPAQPAESC